MATGMISAPSSCSAAALGSHLIARADEPHRHHLVLEQTRVGRRAQAPVEDHPHRRAAFHAGQPAGEARIVGHNRAAADQDGVGAGAQQMSVGARQVSGDPGRRACFAARNAAVAADGELQGHRRTAFGHAENMAQRHLAGFVVQHALGHLDAGGAQPCDARRPAVRGSGSPMATTTRAGPAAAMVSAQAAPLPSWAQGSRVT